MLQPGPLHPTNCATDHGVSHSAPSSSSRGLAVITKSFTFNSNVILSSTVLLAARSAAALLMGRYATGSLLVGVDSVAVVVVAMAGVAVAEAAAVVVGVFGAAWLVAVLLVLAKVSAGA